MFVEQPFAVEVESNSAASREVNMHPSKSACLPLLIFLSFSSPSSAQARGSVLFPFPAAPACWSPLAPLVADNRGNLYGTGSFGGVANAGCVFELSPDEDEWEETVIQTFNGADGSDPRTSLTFDKAGNLFGTAGGGAYGGGIVFELSPSVEGAWAETVLYNFGGWEGDGWGPEGKLIFDGQGNIYGITGSGGPHEVGTVFKLNPSDGGWTETILYSFSSGINGPGGSFPAGGLVADREGRLYGVTLEGGEFGGGALFELSPSESSTYAEKIIHSFDGTDGSSPDSLAIDNSGNLYATTEFGGLGWGAVTELIKQADGSWGENVLHMMNGDDGSSVVGPVVFDETGNLYAAAEFGAINGMGSVFMLTPTHAGPWTETVLHRFDFQFPDGEDGRSPYAGVIVLDGKLFGTTSGGGINNAGIVFEITRPPK